MPYDKQTHFVSCCIAGDRFYLHNFLEGTLLSMDSVSGQMKYLDSEVEDVWFGSAIGYHLFGESLYIVQKDLKYVMCYDTLADRAKCFELPCTFYTPVRPNGSITVQKGEEIYIFPVFDQFIYVFSMTDKKVVRTYELDLQTEVTAIPFDVEKEIEKIEPRNAIFCKGLHTEDNKVWLVPEKGRELVCWFLDEDRQETYWLPESQYGYCDATLHEGELYLLGSDGSLCKWSPHEGWRAMWGAKGKENAFKRVAVTDINIWLLPNAEEKILVYDRKVGKFGSCPYYPQDFAYDRYMEGQSLFYLGCEDKDWYYFSMCAQTHMLWVNKHTGQPHWLKPVPPDMKERMSVMFRHNRIMFEDDAYKLELLLEMLPDGQDLSQDKSGETAGGRIYDCIAGGGLG